MTPGARTSRRAVLAALVALPGGALPGMTWAQRVPARTVRTAAELQETFATAPDGGRLLLAPGVYDHVRLANRRFARGLVLMSLDPQQRAVFGRNLHIEGVENMTITAVDFTTAGFVKHRNRSDKVQLRLRNCRNMRVSNARFTGYIPTTQEGLDPEAPNLERHFALAGYARDVGLNMTGCENMQVEGLKMVDLRTGIGCNTSERIRIAGVEISQGREGINFHDIRDITISDCHLHSFNPWLARASPNRDHPDMIQYWAGSEQIGVHRVEIRDCLFHQGAGQPWTQTIFGHLRNRPGQEGLSSELYVTGNRIINRHVWAIYFGEASEILVADNILLPSPDLPDVPKNTHVPTISLEGCREADVIRNTLLPYAGGKNGPIRVDKGALEAGQVRLGADNRFLSTRPVAPDFWRKLTPDLSSPAQAYQSARGWVL